MTLDDLGTGCRGRLRGPVAAIVGDHQQAIGLGQIGPQRGHDCRDARLLVVGRNEDRDARPRAGRDKRLAAGTRAQALDEEHQARPHHRHRGQPQQEDQHTHDTRDLQPARSRTLEASMSWIM